MKYIGNLYGNVSGKYFKLEEDSEYVENLEKDCNNLKKDFSRSIKHIVELEDEIEMLKEALVGSDGCLKKTKMGGRLST